MQGLRLAVILGFVLAGSCLGQAPPSPTQGAPSPKLRDSLPADAQELRDEKFHWKPALAQTFAFTGVMHLINARQYTGPHDHFFQRYADSVSDYRWDTWFDGNSGVTNNIGHPLMGAIAGSIELRNDPTGRRLQIGSDRHYWNSRLRTLAWATAFSVQWEIGPLSESSLGNYGKTTWVRDGRTVNGTGLTDMIMTPVGGFGWILAEDAVDKWMLPHAGCAMSKKRKVAWAALTPARSTANLFRLKAPWYRDAVATCLHD